MKDNNNYMIPQKPANRQKQEEQKAQNVASIQEQKASLNESSKKKVDIGSVYLSVEILK